MDFSLSDEMKMLQEMSWKFAQQEIAPLSHKHDLEESYTPEIRKKAAENGLVAAWVSDEYGGAGVGILGNSLIVEQLSRVDMGIGLNVYAACFGLEAVSIFGTEEQKKTCLPPCCAGETVWAGAYTEPNAGTDVAGYATRAVRDGDEYVINGQKMFITNGTICDFMLCQCITHPEEKRHRRFSQIIVPADTPGITRNKIKGKMGIRANDTADIAFEDVRVPVENLVGGETKGFYQLMRFFDITRIMVSAQALGLAQACLDESVKYAGERTTFGRPIGTYQITMQKLTEMAIRIEALRNLVYKASWSADSDSPDYMLGSMAKYYGGQTAVFCANAAVEIHGGYGYIDDYKVQKWYRDAKILELYEGTKEAEILAVGRYLQRQASR
ncbi:MAG: acyl-CoA dehydrogenase family protein [Syntrophales bacterium]|nr:acyl-CoA dehydrogenase family protein [Syntrophales bacterium]MCK9528578.1 acyl-CoA dehydrogenase family protein [Syntrophales bacterium]MDX9922785.1 acyl-CoA dehydrogenase family protein [Syntrophales bacterium]